MTVPGPAKAIPPSPAHEALSVIVRVVSGANVTTPGPGELVRLTLGKPVALHVQLVPPVETVLSPPWPLAFGSRLTVRKVPPEIFMNFCWAAFALGFCTPP